jgi:ribonuclease I
VAVVLFPSSTNKKRGEKATTTMKLRNEREKICISAHPEAEKLEEQHHNAQHAHTPFFRFLLALHWLLFEIWGLSI